GRVDEKTGKIIPKKNRAAGTNFLDDAALRSRRFGGSYALVRMAEGIGETWRITEVTRKNRERLKAFGLPEPVKRYTLKEHDFIPQRYLQ
ncbi:MAG TPA: hypothetical protein VLH13_03435, partial [Methanomassiliicoccales archaeon]|nr:hypothetical protein [Methanomassiliicoccales archaeon]